MRIDSLIGELYDRRYRLERRIGSGGMADVYLAQDESLGRPVAIKILSDRYARDAAFVERFRREASAAAKLNHPNIVAIYDRGEAEGTYYIAMEYVEGSTLKEEILARAPLPEAEAVNYAQQALSALEFAHARGIVHRDVKPQNMVLTHDGRLKVMDFGIARAQNAPGMTEVGSIVGTAQYLSPEQARGLDVGPQADLYSLGIVLYEMLAGELPFTGDSAVEIAMRQVSEPPPALRTKNRLVSPGLEQVVMRSLAKDPARRYPSAHRMSAELERVRRGGPVSAETQQATRVIAAGEATRVAEPYEGTRVMPQPAPARRRRGVFPWILVLLLLAAAAGVGLVVYDQLQGQSATVPPKLKGKSCARAQAALRDVDLVGRCRTVESTDAQKGQVIRVDPRAGSSLDAGSVVTLFVGGGPGVVEVPQLRGEDVNDAISQLQQLGLGTNVVSVESRQFKQNQVVSTKPAAGQQIEKGSTVTLRVASGNVLVPNVVGLSEDDARAAIEARALSVGNVSHEFSDTVDEGLVISEAPGAGQSVAQGGSVDLVISKGQQPVDMPNVVGQDRATAIETLTGLGLTPRTSPVTPDDSPECTTDNAVVAQDPQGPAEVPPGSTVQLQVCQLPPQPPPTS